MNPDVASLLLGEMLGEGVSRTVYAHGTWPDDYVVKVAKVQEGRWRDFQNIAEWELWQAASEELVKWLAPCIAISSGGFALVQRRCEPCPAHLLPAKVPKILDDMHDDNFGIYEGRPVATDYGRHLAYAMATNARAVRLVSRS